MYSMYSKTSKHVGSFALGVYNSEEISTEKKRNIFATEERIVRQKVYYLPERRKKSRGFYIFS